MMQRCQWANRDPLYVLYHDQEWGVPLRDPGKLFEMIILEAMQAGLNWFTVLKKREAMRQAFFNFSPEKLARLTDEHLKQWLNHEGIIRNRLKLQSLRNNAQCFLKIAERENVVDYLWQFTEGKTIENKWHSLPEVPAITPESIQMAKQLKKDGFSFLGPTTCYALMQAAGMVNDHLTCCFRWQELKNK
ncbi:DNA-3-methyladenine glycosylase I [Legionella jordanis]|uniref:DNA-3-methyladenine glycosylase I n=1 Tax=Legionella jordanis TaxID=456 RepID=UPI000EFEDA4B|nr:DNA-3-methyladenine glycosylase I [Legionella jordanis]RMX21764.1 DNA-3-methyladenine glycosylase I [Legionella jordanis]